MTPDIISHRLGTVVLEPDGPVVAGSVGQWQLVLTVGSFGIDEGGTIKLSQRFASDWQVPQFDRPAAPAFTTVTTSGQARLRPYYHRKAHERPWMKCLVIDVYDGYLSPGDTVTITLGDRSQGSPGIRAQTFQESAHEFRLLVDPTNASVARRLPTSPRFPVVAGPPAELVCILPTQTTTGVPVSIFVKGEDVWGNPTPPPAGLELGWIGEAEAAVEDETLILRTAGSGYVTASAPAAAGRLACRSNPITAYDALPRLKKYWGDLHAQSVATVGTGTEVEYFRFGRDFARLDFTSHQGNDFQMTDDDWQRLNEVVADFHRDGRFVVFPGYEWSANTPAGGDRNVIYLEEGQPIFRSSHWQISRTPENEQTPAHPASELFRRLRDKFDPDGVLLGAHVGGRYADINRYFDQDLGSLIEVVSCWGIFEWLLWDAFEQDYIVGVMGNSDGHKGRPGAEGPGAGEFGIAGGLTAVLAESLTRTAVFSALKNRRCYGTTGPRIDLSFEIDGRPMGSIIGNMGRGMVKALVKGTAPLEAITLFEKRKPIQTVLAPEFSNCDRSNRIRVSWRGSRIRGRGRRVTWDGAIRVEGTGIRTATPYSFDSAADGITELAADYVTFKSGTTGDTDGVDLLLDDGGSGRIYFDSPVGRCVVDLAELKGSHRRRCFAFDGLDVQVCIERYPPQIKAYRLELAALIEPPTGELTPYFIKVVQSDGHMAWSSPIYISNEPEHA